MKIIKRLQHTDTEMKDSIIGWDVFRSADYSTIDNLSAKYTSIEKMKSKIRKGYTFIFALNFGRLRVFKRLFIKI